MTSFITAVVAIVALATVAALECKTGTCPVGKAHSDGFYVRGMIGASLPLVARLLAG